MLIVVFSGKITNDFFFFPCDFFETGHLQKRFCGKYVIIL